MKGGRVKGVKKPKSESQTEKNLRRRDDEEYQSEDQGTYAPGKAKTRRSKGSPSHTKSPYFSDGEFVGKPQGWKTVICH